MFQNGGVGDHGELPAIRCQLSAYRRRETPICDFEAVGRKLCNFQTLAGILRSANDADLRMARLWEVNELPGIAAPARGPCPQRPPNHGDLPGVIAVVRGELPQKRF